MLTESLHLSGPVFEKSIRPSCRQGVRMKPVDESQVARIYREFGPLVYRRCLRLLGDKAGADDATQEVFVKLLRDADRLKDRATLLPWIYRVAMNHCLNLRRNARRRGEDALAEDLDVMAIAQGNRPDAYPERQLAQAVLSRFDAVTQAVAVGVFVDGMEHEEVASLLGISPRTVSRKLARFVERAREFLVRHGSDAVEASGPSPTWGAAR
jgi:RNA polymerase sigma-70 factor (ECF subfamily)